MRVLQDDIETEELGASIRVTGPNSSGGAWEKSAPKGEETAPLQQDVQHMDGVDEESHAMGDKKQASPPAPDAPSPAVPLTSPSKVSIMLFVIVS